MEPRQKYARTAVFLMLLLGVAYLASIIWINFHGAFWYQTDVYTYALEGRLMHDARSCFPEGWIFGNQYHIISSPNLSALFYGLTQDSVASMAIASSLSALLILLSFYWCFKGSTKGVPMAAGLLCIGGAIVFGRSASTYVSGLQVLYTMASFYACYLIVILLSLGCWLRFREGRKAPWAVSILALLLNFATGMQSLREMLVLVIPLLVMEALRFFYRLAKGDSFKKLVTRNYSLLFVCGILIAEIAGHFYMASLHVATTPIIGDVQLDLSLSGMAAHFWASVKNILRISGLALASDGIRYLPLSICAALVALAILWSLCRILWTKDESPLAQAIEFSLISVLGVLFVGTFLLRTRDIYFFVYWLLAALSIVYLLQHVKQSRVFPLVLTLLVIGIVNYGFNFLPNFRDYRAYNDQLSRFTEKLIDDCIEVVYVDATPVFAAASHDRIISQSYWVDANMDSGYPLTVFPSDKFIPVFDDDHYKHSLICFSGHTAGFLQNASDDYRNNLMSKLVYYDEIVLGNRKFVLYKPLERVIAPLESHHGETD